MQQIAAGDRQFMRKALALAGKGVGRAHPNPLVGAVVVKAGRIVGQGSHIRFGGPHAEVHAIRAAGKAAYGSSLYVTLEPCPHFGKTPPCADLVISSGVRRVYVGSLDPNPKVSGRGLRRLRQSGIRVATGVLGKECAALNKDFAFWIRKKMPYVILKSAQSLDGKIATKTGRSRWITGQEARVFGHRLRAGSDAILVGIQTVLKDNPSLDVREIPFSGRPPLKVVVDSKLRTPTSAKIFRSAGPVLIAASQAPKNKIKRFGRRAEIAIVPGKNGRVNLKALLRFLAQKGIVRVLVEGGGEIAASLIRQKLAREIYCFVAPKIIGGRGAVTSVEGDGAALIGQAVKLKNLRSEPVGEDLLLHAEFI